MVTLGRRVQHVAAPNLKPLDTYTWNLKLGIGVVAYNFVHAQATTTACVLGSGVDGTTPCLRMLLENTNQSDGAATSAHSLTHLGRPCPGSDARSTCAID